MCEIIYSYIYRIFTSQKYTLHSISRTFLSPAYDGVYYHPYYTSEVIRIRNHTWKSEVEEVNEFDYVNLLGIIFGMNLCWQIELKSIIIDL